MSSNQMSLAAGIILGVVFIVSGSFVIPFVAYGAGVLLGVSVLKDFVEWDDE